MTGRSTGVGAAWPVPAFLVGASAFLATFDVTAVSLALPAIGAEFSVGLAGMVWVVAAYSMAFTILLAPAGAIADRHGPKWTLVGGAALFLLGTLACGVAHRYGALIVARAVQGMGAAGISCGGYALVGRIYVQKADRVRAFAIVGTLGGSALVIGPAIGGLVASAFGWRWIFLMKVPICLLIAVGAVAMRDRPSNAVKPSFDAAGVGLFSALLFCAAWSLLADRTLGGVSLPAPFWPLAVLALLSCFVLVELRTPHPAFQVRLFGDPAFVGLALVPLSLAISYWSLVVYLPSFMASKLQMTAAQSSYALLFFTLPMFVVPYAAKGVATAARQSAFFSGGLAVVSIGCLVTAVAAGSASMSGSFLGLTMAGVGAAAIQAQVSGALIAAAPLDRSGSVSAVTTVLRQGGFILGTGVLSRAMQIGDGSSQPRLDRYTVLFGVCSLCAAAGALATFLLVRMREGGGTDRGRAGPRVGASDRT